MDGGSLGVCAAGRLAARSGERYDGRFSMTACKRSSDIIGLRHGLFDTETRGDPSAFRSPSSRKIPPVRPLSTLPGPAAAMFKAKHTKSHSPRTFSNPRRLNRRNPSTFDPPVGRLRQPLALGITRPALGARQLGSHAIAGSFSGFTSACAVPSRPRATWPAMLRNSSSQILLVAIPRIR